jgi:hypothetical protein
MSNGPPPLVFGAVDSSLAVAARKARDRAKGYADSAALSAAEAATAGATAGAAAAAPFAAQASGSAVSAATSAAIAGAARDAATVTANFYPDTTAGLAAVAEGRYFGVPGTGGTYAILYREVGGAAVEVGRYASKAALDAAIVSFNDALPSRQQVLTFAPPFGASDWIGPLAGDQLVFGADANDMGRFSARGIRAESAERMPAIPDYLGLGYQHYDLTAAGQLVGYTDASGVRWVFSVAADDYVRDTGGPVVLPAVAREFPDSALVEQVIHERVRAYLRAEGLLPLPSLTAIPQPAGTSVGAPFVLRADAPGFSDYHFISQCIPVMALAYRPERPGQTCIRRLFRAEYGNRVGPGTNGEEGPAWQRLSYVDIGDDGLPLILRDGAGAPILDTYGQEQPIRTDVCFVMRTLDYEGSPLSVQDSQLLFLEDGRLLYTVTCSGTGGRITWAAVLNNPLTGTASTWDFGPWCPIGAGFSAQPRYIRGEVYMAAANNLNLDPADDVPGVHRCEFYRLHFGAGGIIRPESIGIVPGPTNRALGSFQEPSFAPFGQNGVLCIFRVVGGQQLTRSVDGGRTWTTPVPVPGVLTASSQCDLALSPSGRLVFAHNDSLARTRPSISISETLIDPVRPWEATQLLDDRTTVGQSYLTVEFGRDRDGRYNDVIYICNDRNRGQIIDPATGDWANWLVLQVVRETEVLAGTATPIIYQEGLRS